MSLRERLKAARPKKIVEIPSGNGAGPLKIEARSLTVGQRETFVERAQAAKTAGKQETEGVRITRAVFCWGAHDPETGQRLFQDDDPDVTDLDGGIVDQVAAAVLEASGLDVKALAAAKNASGAGGDSSSGSPATSG